MKTTLLLLLLAARVASARSLDFAAGDIPTNDAKIESATAGVVRVRTGHARQWPGITLRPASGVWDLTPFWTVVVTVRNTGTQPFTAHCRVDNEGADGIRHCVNGKALVEPGAAQRVRVALRRTRYAKLDGKLFGMRGYPVEPGVEESVDAARITQILIFLPKPDADHAMEISDLHAEGEYTPPTASIRDADPFFPFIDTFGQYRHRDWPGKVHSLEELHQRRDEEDRALAAQPAPAGWNRFGGWSGGPQFEATGFFRTQKHAGKWWLVDPEGRLFFSQGIDCVRSVDATPITDRESWFQDFPGAQPELAQFHSSVFALKGHYSGRTPRCYSFGGANLRRKYGAEWSSAAADIAHRRLRSWGLNTIGNWSDESTRLLRRTPYTDSVGSWGAKMIEGSEGYWGKFPDVFDPSFRESIRRSVASRREKSAGDPWCLGYFSDNEMSWGDETSLAVAALRSSPEQAAKRTFITALRERYSDIARLNAAWGTGHASWDALLASRTEPDIAKARADLEAFSSRTSDTYFQIVREAIREAAPHQLYLGCRFAWSNPRAVASAAKFCDVVSFNQYGDSAADLRAEDADVPLLIGEFHFGALDRGMFHTGLVPRATQAARAAAYRDYVRSAIAHPQIVGCHWFQYQDQPTIGRVHDEENFQIGFIDVADTPYPEMIAASRALAADLYSARLAAPASAEKR